MTHDADHGPSARRVWETMMRFTPAALCAALILATFSTTSNGEPAPAPIDPRSIALVEEAGALRAKGDLNGAAGFYESALAIDPRNAAAYIGLGAVAEAQKLDGAAIRYYREAQTHAPGNLDALAGEASALAHKGAVERARGVLAKLRDACRQACPQIAVAERAIAAGPRPQAVAAAAPTEAVTPN